MIDKIKQLQKYYETNAVILKILDNIPKDLFTFTLEIGEFEYEQASLFKHVAFIDGGTVELHVEVSSNLEHIRVAARDYKPSKTIEFICDHMKYKHNTDGHYDHENGSWEYKQSLADPNSLENINKALVALKEIDIKSGTKNYTLKTPDGYRVYSSFTFSVPKDT